MKQIVDLKTLVGSTLILGFRGPELTNSHPIKKAVEEFKLSGVILFDKDMVHGQPVHNIKSPDQVAKLCSSLQKLVDYPLLISIDQEGGLVNRLKPDYGFPRTISHLELGEIDDPEQTFAESKKIAAMLHDAGINLNFAPVVDVDTNFENPIIHKKKRSFSGDPDKITTHARAYIKGHEEFGVLPTIKHFPGHGSSFGDTHSGFTDVSETWDSMELKPYEDLISEGYDKIIMTTHIFNKHLDKHHPSTLSKHTLTDILRHQLSFKGLIISDDIQMGAITEKYGLETAIPLALNAGVNIMCFGNNLAEDPVTPQQVLEIVSASIKSGDLAMETLLKNYRHIQSFIHYHLT